MLAIDSYMAPLVCEVKQRFGQKAHVVFTVDLVPPHEPAAFYDAWCEAVRQADVIHLPSSSWQAYLQRDDPSSPLVQHAAKIQCLTYGIDPTTYEEEKQKVAGNSPDPEAYIAGKRKRKTNVQRRFGLAEDQDAILVVVANRWDLNNQKNNWLIAHHTPSLLVMQGGKAQLIIGNTSRDPTSQNPTLMTRLKSIAQDHPSQMSIDGMDWAQLLAAADMQLMPSKYEPCGLNHLQGMVMGVIPVCSKSGCMGEPPMIHNQNCFLFDWNPSSHQPPIDANDEFFDTLKQAVDTYVNSPQRWNEMVSHAMKDANESTWGNLASRYRDLLKV